MYPLKFSLIEDAASPSPSKKFKGLTLSSSLSSGKYNLSSSSTSKHGPSSQPSCSSDSQVNELMKKSNIPQGLAQLRSLPTRKSLKTLKKNRKLERSKTKGSDWFNLPATELTDEKKRDLELLQMRSVLDSKHFYKGKDSDVLPKYFQIGKIVDNAADFYDRMPAKSRKQTLVDELLSNAETVSQLKKQQQRETADKRRKGVLPPEKRHRKGQSQAYKRMKREKKKKK